MSRARTCASVSACCASALWKTPSDSAPMLRARAREGIVGFMAHLVACGKLRVLGARRKHAVNAGVNPRQRFSNVRRRTANATPPPGGVPDGGARVDQTVLINAGLINVRTSERGVLQLLQRAHFHLHRGGLGVKHLLFAGERVLALALRLGGNLLGVDLEQA